MNKPFKVTIVHCISTSLRRLFSSKHSTMVRYFENTFEDFKPGADCQADQRETVESIMEYTESILKRVRPSPKNVDGGLYVGVAGIAYMFYKLSTNPFLSEYKVGHIEKAKAYLAPALTTSTGEKASFLLGDAGTYALAAALKKTTGDETYLDDVAAYRALLSDHIRNKSPHGIDEYFVGRAGYLAGALWMRRELQEEVVPNEDLYRLCKVIVESGKDYARSQKSECPLMYQYYNTEYLGAAHGTSFILQMLLSVPNYVQKHPKAASLIEQSVNFMASVQAEDGNWPSIAEEVGQRNFKLVHWCHGAPGTVYLMAKAYLVYKQNKYLDACLRAADLVWEKGLLCKGPGICHGVAGNGYVFLLLYRLTNDVKYLYRAKKFADFLNTELFHNSARVPDKPDSLFEGKAGTVCYLSDLLVPDKAEFPFQDVFYDYAVGNTKTVTVNV